MKKSILFIVSVMISFVLYSQTKIDKNNRIYNYHQRFTFNTIGENDYDLGTSSFMSYSSSIIKIDIGDEGVGTLIAYINGQKKFYIINKCIKEGGSYEFELIDPDDISSTTKTVKTIGAAIIVSNNKIQAFKIFKKGKNEAYILMNR